MKAIPGYEGYYATEDGRIYSTKRGLRELNGSVTTDGYRRVTFGRSNSAFIHRLIALAFIENVNNYPQVNHIDGDKSNNKVSNLEWCTAKQNVQHAHRIGLVGSRVGIRKPGSGARGEANKLAVLTTEDIRVIRTFPQYHGCQTHLAQRFKVRQGTISAIRNNKTWKHVK